MSKFSDTYIPFRPGPVLGQRIEAHAAKIGATRSAALRQLIDERLCQIYPKYLREPYDGPTKPERN